MVTKKSLIAGVLALGMVFGVGSSVAPVGASNQKPDDGKTKKVVNIYLHGLGGTGTSTSNLSSTISGISKSKVEKPIFVDFKKESASTQANFLYANYQYSGQDATYYFNYDDDNKRPRIFIDMAGLSHINAKNTGIQLVFAENKLSLEKQLSFLRIAVKDVVLPDTQVNLIGHSMGGLLAVAYAGKYGKDKTSTGDTKINKIVTISSPLNGSIAPHLLSRPNLKYITYLTASGGAISDLRTGSKAIESVQKSIKNIPSSVSIYSLAGSKDGVVTSSSAHYLNSKEMKKNLKASIKVDKFNADHSGILSNTSALTSIKNFLK